MNRTAGSAVTAGVRWVWLVSLLLSACGTGATVGSGPPASAAAASATTTVPAGGVRFVATPFKGLATVKVQEHLAVNLINTDAVLTYNNTFVPGGTWLQPVTVVTARMLRFSAEFTF